MAEHILGIICRKFLILIKDILTDSRYNTKKNIHETDQSIDLKKNWKAAKEKEHISHGKHSESLFGWLLIGNYEGQKTMEDSEPKTLTWWN